MGGITGAVARPLEALRRPASANRGTTQRRWAVVLAGIALACTVPGLIGLLPARADGVDLAELRSRILAADPAHAGYAESVGSLGLPDLPAIDNVAGLLGGRTRMRVWHAAANAWRVDVLTAAGEQDQYGTQTGTTAWDYEENLRTDLIGFPALRMPRPADLLPPALARRLLAAAGPNARLESLPARRVAGVSAVGLRARPTDPDTTVGAVDVWADPRTGLPVAVDVVGRTAGPADLRSAFLELDQGPEAVPAARLDPPAPADAQYTVAEAPQVSATLDERLPDTLPDRIVGRDAQIAEDQAPRALRVYGSGLAGFAALTLPPGLDLRIFRAARVGGATIRPLTTMTGSPIRGFEDAPQTAVIRTPLLILLVLTDTADGSGYLLAGPVVEGVLLAAARELALADARQVR